MPGSLHKSSGWAEQADPSRKGYHIQRPPDASKRSEGAGGCGSGIAPPQRAPCAEGMRRPPAPSYCVCGLKQGNETHRRLQPHFSLNSQPCAERQLNSSLAVISRDLTLLTQVQQQRASVWQGKASGKPLCVACFITPYFSKLPVAVLSLTKTAPVSRSLKCSSPEPSGNSH